MPEEGSRLEEGKVPEEEMLRTMEGPVSRELRARSETLAPVEEVQDARLGTSGELQALISTVKKLTKVVMNGFKELRSANHLQRLVNEDRIERIRRGIGETMKNQ